MTTYDYLIIGGGIAGTMAAETIRKQDATGSIAIVEEEPYRLYSKVMLSKPPWFLGKVPFDAVWLKTEAWYQEQKIDLLIGHLATSLDPKKKVITCADKTELGYGKLLLATGASARPWTVNGADKDGVFPLRTLDDGKGIIATCERAKRAVLVGGGFISFEIAELLRDKNIDVTVLSRESYYWEPVLDPAAGRIVEAALKQAGVKLLYKTDVQEVLGGKSVEGVRLSDGTVLDCELVVCGIGVIYLNDWLASSGLAFKRGILANEYLETNLPDVWTAGDAAQYQDAVLNEEAMFVNWANAMTQGQVAGQNMAGVKTKFEFVSMYSAHGFGTNIAFVGETRVADGCEALVRGDDGKTHGVLVLRGNKLIGATLINRNDEIGALKKVIEQRLDLTGKTAELVDPAFDLNTLLT